MVAVFADPIVRLFAAPLVASFLLTGLIRWVGADGRGDQLAATAVPIVFSWVAAFELGAALFPPSADDNALLYLVAIGLLIGIACDFFRAEMTPTARHAEAGIALLLGLTAAVWIRGVIDAWTGIIVIAWGIVVLRVHVVASRDASTASAVLALAAGGLGAVAWAAGLEGERNLAFGLASATAGYFLLNLFNPGMRFGATLVLAGVSGLLILCIRLMETTQAVGPAVFILGFVFFSDSPARRLFSHRRNRWRWMMPWCAALASLLPIGLAALAAFVGVNFEVT